MNFNKLKSLIFILAILVVHAEIKAQTNSLKLQSTAVPFMMISPDARSGGMGNLSLGMTPEANDLFGNTAKLSFLKEPRGISKKIQSYSHSEFNIPEFTDEQKIENRIKLKKDIFDRNYKYEKIDMDNSYPKYILNNLALFKNYLE